MCHPSRGLHGQRKENSVTLEETERVSEVLGESMSEAELFYLLNEDILN